jgi:hypothetical protein
MEATTKLITTACKANKATLLTDTANDQSKISKELVGEYYFIAQLCRSQPSTTGSNGWVSLFRVILETQKNCQRRLYSREPPIWQRLFTGSILTLP